MSEIERYKKTKEKLLTDTSICPENIKLFKTFFEQQEYKLKRTNNLPNLDIACCKTLLAYISRFRQANNWFKNKPWTKLTEKDIKKVYDDLEDGKILTRQGTPYKDRVTYYNKVFKSKPFEIAGKAEIARKVMEFYKPNGDGEVRFFKEETHRKMVDVAIKPLHKTLLWTAFDIGENIFTLLRLQKKHFVRHINSDNKEPEYFVNLPRELLKRARKPRTEITNYLETVKFLDISLRDKKDDDVIFDISYPAAKKFLRRCVDIVEAKCSPNGQRVTWEDFRKSMVCDLLSKGWTRDELNARLGHKPSSSEIDKYINFLAIERKQPKKKLHASNIQKVQDELEEMKRRETLQARRMERLQKQVKDYEELENVRRDMDIILSKSLEDKGRIDKQALREVIQDMIKSGDLEI